MHRLIVTFVSMYILIDVKDCNALTRTTVQPYILEDGHHPISHEFKSLSQLFLSLREIFKNWYTTTQ